MSATIVITEDGIICAHGINEQNALLIAQYARNLHENLLAQMQANLQARLPPAVHGDDTAKAADEILE